MIMQDMVDRFEQKAPVCVMARALLENVLSPERLDAIYSQYDHKQLDGVLLFSTLVEIMGLVATRVQPSVHAVYQTKVASAEIAVTVKAVYDKLQRIRGGVSQALLLTNGRENEKHSQENGRSAGRSVARLQRADFGLQLYATNPAAAERVGAL